MMALRLAPSSNWSQLESAIYWTTYANPSARFFVAGVSLLPSAKTADAITTRRNLDQGGWENNPVFGRHPSPAKQAGINLAVFVAQAGAFYLTEHSRHSWIRTGRALLATATEEHARLAACNAGINTRSPVVQSCNPFPPGVLSSKRDAQGYQH